MKKGDFPFKDRFEPTNNLICYIRQVDELKIYLLFLCPKFRERRKFNEI